MANAAERMKRYRARRKAGEILLTVKADETALVQGLIAAQLLSSALADNRAAITNAAQRLIEIISKEE